MRGAWVVLGAVLVGCGARPVVSATPDAPKPVEAPKLEFIEDDYAAARSVARESHKPLFVDAWASWCHSCLSLRAFVFQDPALRPLAAKFVWASIDTEKDANAAFLAKFPNDLWPTLWVIDPETETPLLRWPGTATAPELAGMLEDAARSFANGQPDGAAAAAAVRGDRAAAKGDAPAAIKEYKEALATAGADWPRRPRVVDALLQSYASAKDWVACVDLAMKELPDMAPGTPRADVAVGALTCATALPKWSSKHQDLAPLVAIIRRTALDPNNPILADDRSGLFEALVEYYTASGDPTSARQMARAWATFLEEQAAKAPSKEARVVFDGHRLSAYLELGEPERAIPMLQESERDFPQDATPPARLARAYAAMQKWGDALAAIERAIARGYGPRVLRYYEQKSDVLLAKGDKPKAKKALEDGVAYGQKLRLSGAGARALEALKARLSKM
jgi:tetratricopeptide (TPR) repeat protein